MKVFWRKGYEGTSLLDLTQAMRINRPSLYAAFGNKESLFRKVLDRYSEGPVCYVKNALSEPTARAVVERLFQGVINMLTESRQPRGCLIVQAALACGEESDRVRKELAVRREASVVMLRERFERAQSEGDLPVDADPADLARYIATLMHGMSVQAASGARRDELEGIVKMALRAWPA